MPGLVFFVLAPGSAFAFAQDLLYFLESLLVEYVVLLHSVVALFFFLLHHEPNIDPNAPIPTPIAPDIKRSKIKNILGILKTAIMFYVFHKLLLLIKIHNYMPPI